MSTIYGDGKHIDTAVNDPKLLRALEKLSRAVQRITPSGCRIIPYDGPVPPRFMIDGDSDLARRWSWRIFNGPIPEGHRIYVTCGEPRCVAPTHLKAYRAEPRPKSPRKIVRPRAKLTWESVASIRSLADPSVAELAYQYEVHPSTIRNILAGKTWVA